MTTNRYILVVITLITSIVTFSSCSDFLDQEPESNASVSSFYKSESDVEEAVNAAYNSLAQSAQYGGNFIYLMEVRSDNSCTESITNSGGIYGDIDLFRESAYNTVLNDTWVGCYDGIKRCNIVLDRISDVSMDETTRNKYTGEMLFIRALTYFNLVRLWGDVPMVTHYYEDPFEAFNLERTSVEEVYKQIETDLTEAAELLPDEAESKNVGSATSYAAKTLLGKVYLTLGEYDNAANVLRDVINSNKYTFLSNYADIFDVDNKNNEESIFEIQYTSSVSGMGSAFANIFAPIGSTAVTNGIGNTEGNNEPTDEFYNSYDENDLRKDVSIGVLSDGRTYCKKFVKIPVLANQSDANFIVLRYTDVLLMYAEAINETAYNPAGEAFTYLNMVRKRAGLSELSSQQLSNQSEFREALMKERRYEFAFENQRWFDLLRSGKAVETINNSGSVKIDDHQLLFPIPQDQIDISSKITQNKDY